MKKSCLSLMLALSLTTVNSMADEADLRVDALLARGQTVQAVKLARDWARRAPNDALAQVELGRALLASGDGAGAEAAWRAAYKMDADSFVDRVGDWYVDDHDQAVAEASAHWVRWEPRSDVAWYYRGLSLLFLNRPREAVAPLQRSFDLLDLDEDGEDAAYMKAQIGFAHGRAGDLAAARQSWDACFDFAPSICYDTINEHLDRGYGQVVLEAAKVAIDQQADFDDGYYYAGWAAHEMGDFELARRYAAESVQIDPEDAYNQCLLAQAEIDRGNLSAARDALAAAEDLDDETPLLWETYAAYYTAKGEPDAAAQARERQQDAERALEQ